MKYLETISRFLMRAFTFSYIWAILIITSCANDEENLNGTIAGIITDYTNANAPIAGATITVSTKGLTKTTGSDGRYEYKDIEPGTYTLQVSADRFQTTTKQVTVYAGQTVNCDFQLEKAGSSVHVSPVNLSFGKDVEQLSFTIQNTGNQSLTFSISNAPDFIEISPASGTVAAKSSQAISVHVQNRSSITSNRSGQLTVNVGNDSYIVSINVSNSINTDSGQGGNGNDNQNQGQHDKDVTVTRGLLAYYTFNDGETATNVIDPTSYNGQLFDSPEFTTGSNGSGYSMHFKKGQYVSVPQNMLSGKRAYSICMWVRDFGQGYLYQTLKNNEQLSPVIGINSNDRLTFKYNGETSGWYSWSYLAFSTDISKYQGGGWHHLAVIKNSANNALLYVDGVLVDIQACGEETSDGMNITLGSATTDPMYIDNVRIHGIALSADEIKQIYNSEK